GADGETWTQMRDALGFEGLDEPAINAGYRDMIDLLGGLDPHVQLGIANSVWARAGIAFYEDFLDRTRTWFDAYVEELDFSDPATLGVINGWVEDRTNGRIRDLIDEIPDEAIMYLVNAIYFNGDWRYQFDRDETRPLPFTRANRQVVQAETMGIETDLRYFMDSDVSVVELPYGGGAFTAIATLGGARSSSGAVGPRAPRRAS
ncbi:MAG: serpin family protein, partial [Gemmatimonas sp.]|nr:serpin family protein [Gemmatimonas sp.]